MGLGMKSLLTVSIATAAAASIGPAFAEKVGDWRLGFGQGYNEYRLEHGPGNDLTISCDSGNKGYGVNIFMHIRDKAPPGSSIVRAISEEDEFQIITDGDGVGVTECSACRSNFEAMLESLKVSDRLTIIFEDGRSITFRARGTKEAFSEDVCRTLPN
jgi:hypothetical protein